MNRKLQFRTNLNCGSCVAAVAPFLDRDDAIDRWSVDTKDPRKVLTVEGDQVSQDAVRKHLDHAGFKVLSTIDDESGKPVVTTSSWMTYYPLGLIVLFLLGGATVLTARDGALRLGEWMQLFMGGFFLVFSFFKLLNLRGFVDAFMTYDVLARRSRLYGYAYPFIELALGIAYVTGIYPLATYGVTIAIMLIGIVGVTAALRQNRPIQCACLGTVFNLPMSKVTFFENASMAAMALAMIIAG